jgi:hypothetical protein
MMPAPGAQKPMWDLADTTQEVVHLAVGLTGCGQVLRHTHVGTDQVIAMHAGRHGTPALAGIHKLQQRHLCRSVLHGHTVGTEVYVVGTSLERLQVGRVEQVGIKHLLGVGERAAQYLTGCGYFGGVRSIKMLQHVNIQYHFIHHNIINALQI